MTTPKYKYETSTVKIPTEKQKGYQVSHDKLNGKLVKIYFYKGFALGAVDWMMSGKLIMVRLRIRFMGDLSKYIPVDALVSKNMVEEVDIDFSLIEHFFGLKMDKYNVQKLLSPLYERCKFKNIGENIGTITVDYETFTKLVTFLQYLSFETFKKEDLL